MVEVVTGFPPNIDDVVKAFPLTGREIFAWGDTIYNPAGDKLSPWLIEHEKVHFRQQAEYPGGVEAWWARYLIDPEWRLEQELEAHRVEYREFMRHYKDRNVRVSYLNILASRMSAPMYGKIITRREALRRIR